MQSESLHAASADSWMGRGAACGTCHSHLQQRTSCAHSLTSKWPCCAFLVYNLCFSEKRGTLETGVFTSKGSKKITPYKATFFHFAVNQHCPCLPRV